MLRGIERCLGSARSRCGNQSGTHADRTGTQLWLWLEKKSAALLQALRGNRDEEITELRYEVTAEYIGIVQAIRSLASELGIFM